MRAIVRLKLEMAARVRDFLRNHPLEGPGFTAAMAWFDELLARATGHSTQQQEGIATSRGVTVRRAELRTFTRESLLRHLVGVGIVAAKDRPDLTQVFRLPEFNAAHLPFVTAANRLLREAETNQEFLVSKGLDDSTVEDLKKALAELESVDSNGHAARASHVGARADLDAVAAEIMDQVRLLDGTVRYRFRNDPELLAAWKSARNLPRPSARKQTGAVDGSTPQVPPAAAA